MFNLILSGNFLVNNIIPIAILLIIVAFIVIFKDEILNKTKALFSKKSTKQKKSKKQSEPVEESKPEPEPVKEEKPEFKPEDFKPLTMDEIDNLRDSSLDDLFADLFADDNNNVNVQDSIDNAQPKMPRYKKAQNTFFDDDFTEVKKSNKKKNVAEQIRNASPELKALLMDSILKKRDDI